MRQAASGTRKQHSRTLSALVSVCGAGRSVTLMTADDFSATIDRLRHAADQIEMAAARATRRGPIGFRRGRSEQSLNIDRSVLRRFVHFLHVAGHLPQVINPAISLESARKARGHGHKRQPMGVDAVIALLDLAGEYHPRERIAVALAVLGGLRESEILGLKWNDIIWQGVDGPILEFYRPKTKDTHRVWMIPQLERELRAWHAFYSARHREMNPSWYVVPARKRGRMPAGKAGRGMDHEWPLVPNKRANARLRPTIKPLMAKAGVADLKGKGLHTLRRTYANVLLEHSKDIRVVQTALGHKSQLTTEIYLDRDRDFQVAAAAMRNWNPFAPRQTGENVIPFPQRRDAS